MIGGALLAALGGRLLATFVDSLARCSSCGASPASARRRCSSARRRWSRPRAADRRAEASSYFSVAVFTGLGLGPSLGELVLDGDGYQLGFTVAAGFAVARRPPVPRRAHVPPPPLDDRRADGPGDGPGRPPGRRRPRLVLALGIGAFAVFTAFLPDHARSVGLAGSGGLFAAYSVVCLALRIRAPGCPSASAPAAR